MRGLDENAQHKTDQVALGQQGVGAHGVIAGILPAVERGADALDPVLRSLLGLVVDSNVDGIEIDHLLKADGDNVGGIFAIGTPIGAQPIIEGFVLTLGIDVPRTKEDAGLFVLGELVLLYMCLGRNVNKIERRVRFHFRRKNMKLSTYISCVGST